MNDLLVSDDNYAFPPWVPRWLHDQVANPDCSRGTHPRLLWGAKWLSYYFKNDPDQVARWLYHMAARCVRHVPDDELDRLLAWAPGRFWGQAWISGSGGAYCVPPPPAADLEVMYEIARQGPSLDEFIASSPVKLDSDNRHACEVLSAWAGYAGVADPLICYGARTWDFNTCLLSETEELWRYAQIVPSPMSARRGRTQAGHMSAHSKDNTGTRVMLIAEFDLVSISDHGQPTLWAPLLEKCRLTGINAKGIQAAVLNRLAQSRRLWMVVDSGGKSLQGWFPCRGEDEEALSRWFTGTAQVLGACHSTWSKSQFVRMPDGTRTEQGRRQAVLYYDPGALL
jgi:hypothetical protein